MRTVAVLARVFEQLVDEEAVEEMARRLIAAQLALQRIPVLYRSAQNASVGSRRRNCNVARDWISRAAL